MFYVDINAEVENQQAAKEAANIASHNGNSCDVKSSPLRTVKMSTSKVSPRASPSLKHRLIKNESMNDDDDDDSNVNSMFARCTSIKKQKPARVPPIDCKRKQKSDTIKSNNSGLEDFSTPPQSPSLNSASLSLSSKADNPSNLDEALGGNLQENDEKSVPPVPPPRTRRGMATKSAKNKLKELHIAAESLEIVAYELTNIGESLDMSLTSTVPHNGTPEKIVPSVTKVENDLKGYMHMLVISAKGLRQTMKTRWFVYDKKAGKLKYYRDESHELQGELPIGQLDLSTATFCYDVETDTSGEFTIVTRMGEHTLSAGTSDKRMYWLSQLQRARREFSQAGAAAAARSSMSCQVGLLKSPMDESPTNPIGGNISAGNALSQASAIAAGNMKESSPFKDIMQTLEKPPPTPPSFYDGAGGSSQDGSFAIGGGVTGPLPFKNSGVYNSPPRSADYYMGNKNKGSSFSFIKNNFRLPRSNSTVTSSMSQHQDICSNPVSPSRPLASGSTPGSFQALSKIRKSLRDKRSASSGSFGGVGSPKRPNLEQVKSVGSFASSSLLEDNSADMIAAFKDEAQASKEVINVLRNEMEKLEMEKETLTKIQRPEFNDGHLLEILRQKDSQIIGMESIDREKQRELDLKRSELEKVQTELKVFEDLIGRKDDSIVELTNQLHEMELNNVQANAVVAAAVLNSSSVPFNVSSASTGDNLSSINIAQNSDLSIIDNDTVNHSVGGGEDKSMNQLSLSTIMSVCSAAKKFQTVHSHTSGMSFDSEKMIFREFVEVGTQTNPKGHQSGAEITPSRRQVIEDENPPHPVNNVSSSLVEWEKLQDTVAAYEMQNKFLNKEVLELNQLRTQANDREQKLFIEASDWEAKFYQIQSKYLLILNELHNPQVGVSASRQEMVSQLLKDVIEAAETRSGPLASTKNDIENGISKSKNVSYDRFGFRIDIGTSTDSVEEKVDKLRKHAENQLQNQTAEKEEMAQLESREGKWNEAIATLNSNHTFTMTSDIKSLLRLGIPISQRGAVWKAIVEKRVMRCGSEKFQKDYYKKLLANYNPSQKYTSAAKQIELDLLRTLPNNKHYDGPHADGIAKLRRILLAYSVHNPEVEYCQGFNRIAAITLLFMHEEDAFWCLVFIIEHLMPPEYYSRDKQLIGAQVDQEVLKELINEKLPKLSSHFSSHGIDPTLFTLNWFLCLFVDDPMPVKTYLHIWDAFLFEGSKVLFRYAIAIFKYMENILLQQTDYMTIYHTLRDGLETLVDTRKLTQIAFHDLNPFPMRSITHKRDHHYKLLEAKKKELDHIRQNYRKNSLARTSSSVAMKPIMAMAGITAGDFVDETMEDELNIKENAEKEDTLRTEDAKNRKKEEIVSGNSGCSDDKK